MYLSQYLIEALSRCCEGSITALERERKGRGREREERCFQADFRRSLGERSGSKASLVAALCVRQCEQPCVCGRNTGASTSVHTHSQPYIYPPIMFRITYTRKQQHSLCTFFGRTCSPLHHDSREVMKSIPRTGSQRQTPWTSHRFKCTVLFPMALKNERIFFFRSRTLRPLFILLIKSSL